MEESNKVPTVENMRKMIFDVLVGLNDMKPNDRSPVDRKYAVCITEMEKVNAYFNLYIAIASYVEPVSSDK